MKSRQGVILCWPSSHSFYLSAFVAGEPWATKRRHLSLRIAWALFVYRLDKVYLSMKQIADAEDLIDNMERTTPPAYERRQTLYALDRAKCYMALGQYEQAAMMLLDALMGFKTMGTHHYLAEIKKLCQKIKKGPYGDQPDLAELEMALSKCDTKKM